MTVRAAYPGPAVRVLFLARPNRYLARVRRRGSRKEIWAHIPNPGRMEELLVPGLTEGYVIPAEAVDRKTRFDLVSVRAGRTLVSIDSRIGNRIVRAALDAGRLADLGRGPWSSEVTWRGQRLDFARFDQHASDSPTALLEVKSSNLRVGTTALFPDAPTKRGSRHLRALSSARQQGIDATILFLIQRSDVQIFAPNRCLDPEFARAFDEAARVGVRMIAQTVRVRPLEIEWDRRLAILPALPREPI